MTNKATKTQAKTCYDNYFGVLHDLNSGTREENERSAGACRTELEKYVREAEAILRNPGKLLAEDAWLMRALSEDIPNNFKAFCNRYPVADLIESAAQAVEEIGADELEQAATPTPERAAQPQSRGELLEALKGLLDNYLELKRLSLITARSDSPNWAPGLTENDDVHVIRARAAIAKAEQPQ